MNNVRQAIIYTFMIAVSMAAATAGETQNTSTTIRVGIRSGTPPLCFLEDTEGGAKLRGMNIDIMEQAGKMMNARIAYVDIQHLDNRWEMLKRGQIDAIAFSGYSENHSTYVKFVPVGVSLKRRIYVHQACKTVVCTKDLEDKTVGILAGDSWNRYGKVGEVVSVISELEGLVKLDRGELDAFIAPSELVAGYLIQKHKLTSVLQVGMVLDTMPLYIAVKAENLELRAALSEAITQLERKGMMQTIQEKWYGVAFPENYWNKYGQLVLLGVGFAGLTLLAVILWNQQLKKQIRKVTLNLQISESKSKALIEFSPDMIFVVNPDGDIINANKEARNLIMGDLFDMNGAAKLIDFAVDEEKLKFRSFTASVFQQGQASDEFRFFDLTRSIRELSIAATPISNGHHGTEPVACFFARDVTERNRIERELVQADRMSMMGQMAACVAHEINNPLGIVRANLELIASRGWFTKEADPCVDAIRRNTERAGNITKTLLAITKPGNAVMAEVNLRELLEKTLSMVRPQLSRVVVECRDFEEAPIVFGDRNLLQQVLVNIFLNAKDALIEQENPIVTITCCSKPDESIARIRVTDNGAGIAKKLLLKVFEPFFTHGKKEGFGLGLFISQRIIERHNGLIFAESDIGNGTQIMIELPLISPPEQVRIA